MFERQDKPRVFALAPGVDFPRALALGLQERLQGQPPEARARVDLIVNTSRMQRRLTQIFADTGPSFLPRIHLLTNLDRLAPNLSLPPATPPLRRRLELAQLVASLIEAEQELAQRGSHFALADSLATLFDEMQGEDVTAADIARLDVSNSSGHWERAQKFIKIADTYLASGEESPDPEARQRLFVKALIASWEKEPPTRPLILAGSTGSRGTTALLMEAVARLPQGAVVLPGFDDEMPTAVWQSLDRAGPSLAPEDHPQYRFRSLMRALGLAPSDIRPWQATPPPSADRNRLISLSLRPAPVTHAWLTEGPRLGDLARATEGITLLEAPSQRMEALAIAMRLRRAAADGQRAALITPDRMLTRQVTAALDRWEILPDDSAGTPLQLSPPGRLLRHTAQLMAEPLDAARLLTLLKHPLTHAGAGRGGHGLNLQHLEAAIRDHGLPYPTAERLLRLPIPRGARESDGGPVRESYRTWLEWVAQVLTGQQVLGELSLGDWVARHIELTQQIVAGAGSDDAAELWRRQAGEKARTQMQMLVDEAGHGGQMTASLYTDLVGGQLANEEVRDRDAGHPGIMIWGTLEARVQGAELVILGGLNEGSWPEAPPPDPWLNRAMRAQAGLLLPERRTGLSAHDYQQAVAAPEVWLSRSIRSEDAETVPSRWLNRLGNLLTGLKAQEGPEAWRAMQDRGNRWLARAWVLEEVTPQAPAPRPSPQPPKAARFDRLSVTEVKRLIRDPYAVYARHILKLRPSRPLVQAPDAPLRGIVLHQIMERFVRQASSDPTLLTADHLNAIAREVLEQEAPWPSARTMWAARIARIAPWFVANEKIRQANGTPQLLEKEAKGVLRFPDIGVSLTGFADRIDLQADGRAVIYDYKTGTPPGGKEQRLFDKQLLLEAAMLEEGAFSKIGVAEVADALFIGLGSTPKEVAAPLDEQPLHEVLAGLRGLIQTYREGNKGFTARLALQSENDQSDYDQLSRFGEWDTTDWPRPEQLK